MSVDGNEVRSNNGQSAAFFHQAFPQAQIFSIDPVATVYQELLTRSRAWHRVRCLNMAIASRPSGG
jgi:hypothetical protein